MRLHKLLGSLALVLVIGATASCSDDKSSDTISKADFLTKANALCATFNGKIEAAEAGVTTEDEQVDLISTLLIPELRNTLTAIRALGFPKGDEALIGGLMDQTNEKLDAAAADPASLVNPPADPFVEINAQLVDYGLTECGGG